MPKLHKLVPNLTIALTLTLTISLALPLALAASCDVIKGGELAKPPELDFAEVMGWDSAKVQSTFGAPSFIVRTQRGDNLYYSTGEQQPTQVMEPQDFAQQFPSGDPRILPFAIIVLYDGSQPISLFVSKAYEDPAQRIGFLGKRLNALRKPEVGNLVGEPDGTGWSGVGKKEFRYDWKFGKGEGPLPKLPFKYTLQVTFDGDSPLVTSVLASKIEN